MPNDSSATPPALPGDIVQVTIQGRRGALVVVEQVRPWGLTGYMPLAKTKDYPTDPIPVRLHHGEYVPVGTAAIASRALVESRRAAQEALRALVAAETPSAEPTDAGDLTPRWDVEVRVLEQATGTIQKHHGRVRADCVEDALDRLTVEGGRLVGVTIDERAS